MSKVNTSGKQIRWVNCVFLLGTLLLALTVVPAFIWMKGLDWFQVGLFLGLFICTGLSITLGYHRLFSHRAFQASWPVRFLTLVFGAGAFENSAYSWAAHHRRHHKHVDHDEDPYDATKGLFHSHIGWILFKTQDDTPLDIVKDLQKDKLVMWQHNHYLAISIFAGFLLPAILGGIWNGWEGAIGGFLVGGLARVVSVQHFTFFINSLCHYIGQQPYSTKCTARDSAIMALFTFGEGYHNFHHTFQHDYRNGLKPWQFDPTKWTIWMLSKVGMAKSLRRVPQERILLAEITEQHRLLAEKISLKSAKLSEPIQTRLQAAQARLQEAFSQWEKMEAEYGKALEKKLAASREKLAELRWAKLAFQKAIQDWRESYRLALDYFATQSTAA